MTLEPLALRGGALLTSRRLRRLRLDSFDVLALGLSLVGVLVVGLFGSIAASERLWPLVPAFLAAQLLAGRLRFRLRRRMAKRWIHILRLAMALGFVALLVMGADDGGRLPLTALYLPVVAMAAATGRFQTIAISASAIAIYVAVEILDNTTISYPAAVYSLFMFVFATLWGLLLTKKLLKTPQPV